MIIGSKDKSNSSPESIEIQIARLEYIAALIVTLGDGVGALALGLELKALEKSANENSRGQYDQARYQDYTQKQIDYLIEELTQIRRMMF